MNPQARKILIFFGDILLLLGTMVVTLLFGFWGSFESGIFFSHVLAFSFLFLVWLVILYSLDLYDLSLPISFSVLSRFFLAWVCFLATGAGYFYLVAFTQLNPKTNLVTYVSLFIGTAFIWRLVFSLKLSAIASWRIGFLDVGEEEQELRQSIESLKQHGYQYIPVSIDRGLEEQIKEYHLQALVFPHGFFSDPKHIQTLYACLGEGVSFFEPAQVYEVFTRRIPLSTIDQQWFIRNLQEKERGISLRLKQTFDMVGALLILVLTLPLWMLIALAIKLEDGGAIFYEQQRVGKHGKTFFIKKFRTMRNDAEVGGVQWAQESDPRVTRVGRVLRTTHLDELPQMLNVLKGDLSLVGPRPERPEFVRVLETEIPHYHVRHFIKPGFTGWAQIKFRYARSVSDSKTKFEYDLYYLKNRSPIMDALILLKTVQLFFR
ncbi:exopolysaccharide biosynthesis polyprenyl glycosylphosphotransferase [Candidatus Uhrbacteria bacterium]|nr:exopolysaccharide biosynthesis polyprenyl glycosylphosphotransferase [Candidatus Uhrbacteria bacterium]